MEVGCSDDHRGCNHMTRRLEPVLRKRLGRPGIGHAEEVVREDKKDPGDGRDRDERQAGARTLISRRSRRACQLANGAVSVHICEPLPYIAYPSAPIATAVPLQAVEPHVLCGAIVSRQADAILTRPAGPSICAVVSYRSASMGILPCIASGPDGNASAAGRGPHRAARDDRRASRPERLCGRRRGQCGGGLRGTGGCLLRRPGP